MKAVYFIILAILFAVVGKVATVIAIRTFYEMC